MPLPRLPRPERRAALALIGAGIAALTLPARAQGGFDLVQLMRMLALIKAGEATFVETRSVAMLDHTLHSSGRLSFEAPDTFVRETLTPRRERIAVVGNLVTMSLGTRTRTAPLDSMPEAAVIMEAIRGTLTGNREAIERNFSATVSGTPQRWTLVLTPNEPRLRALVVSVRLSGRQALVHEMTVAMADGDRSVMTIEPVVPGTRSASAAS